jgi:hypothetical protein
MGDRSTKIKDVLVIVVVWLIALGLLWMVIIKIKYLLNR